jgi:exonuclease SbcC
MTNIIIDSIRLRNFGAVKEATLKPLHEGLTGIAGVSGAGKTTFLKGMRFALFNDVPKNVKIANLRRIGSDYKKDECSVSVVFFHEGQKIEVVRQLVGKNSQNIPAVYVDGIEVVHTSSSTAESWVKKRIGMDAKDFTTATVIPQKQLDELVDDTPSVRRARIEKLAGIESMSAAVKAAREEENAIKAQANAMPGSVETLTGLEEEVNCYTEALSENTSQDKNVADYLLEIEQEYISSQASYDDLLAKKNEYISKKNAVTALESRLTALQDNRDLVSTQLDSAVSRFEAGAVSDGEDLEKSLAKQESIIASLSEKIRAFKLAVSSLDQKIAYETNLLDEKKSQLESLQLKIVSLEASSTPVSDADIENAETAIVSIQDEISAAGAKKNQLMAEWTETSDSVKLLSSTVHDAECPTCHSHLPDPSGLIETLKKAMERIKAEGNALNGTVDRLNGELSVAKNEYASLRATQRDYLSAMGTIDNYRSNGISIEAEIVKIKDSLHVNNEELEAAYLFDADTVGYELDDASEAKNAILRRLEAVKHTEQARKEMESLKAKLTQVESSVAVLKAEVESAQDEFSKTDSVDEDELDILKSALEATAGMIRAKQEIRNDLAVQISTNKVRLENAKKEWTKEKTLISSKAKLLNELEHKAAVSDVLDEFRKSSIAKIAPELADSATDLISAMTNGKFVQIDLDSEFTPSVTNSDGHSLTIHQLSGGELSVVALALRIAIGTLIGGGTGGMLWLDEVLSAQDVNRRHAILQAIRALPVNQIVMINHTQEAEDVVDKVVRMTYSGDEGSYIEDNDEDQ